ncbi:MAG: hypothetical protein JRJ38_19830 [Deltaproteobacteria bacterium]|nr:hypothetical protein [Deltaproteobacteria bacterium]
MKIFQLLGGKPKDKRSGRIVAAINCILNQNARDYGAAKYQGMNSDQKADFLLQKVAAT